MTMHSPMMGCFNPGCPQCACTESPRHVNCHCKIPEVAKGAYVRYHEIANLAEKPKPGMLTIADIDQLVKSLKGTSNTKENTNMPTFTIDVSDYFNGPSKPSSRITDQHIFNKIKEHSKEDPEFAKKVKEAAECAVREHKEEIEKALKGVNFLAMKEGHSGRDFCVSFWYNGKAHSLDGTDYAYGRRICEDDAEDEYRVYVGGNVYPISDTYYTMDYLKKCLEGDGILYVIEYYPDQD